MAAKVERVAIVWNYKGIGCQRSLAGAIAGNGGCRWRRERGKAGIKRRIRGLGLAGLTAEHGTGVPRWPTRFQVEAKCLRRHVNGCGRRSRLRRATWNRVGRFTALEAQIKGLAFGRDHEL